VVRIVFSHARLIEALKSLFFPITAFELLDGLEKSGYRLLGERPLPIPPTHHAYVSGRVAEKEGCFVVVNSERKLFGVEGSSPGDVSRVYQDLFNVIEQRFNISIDEERDYLEFVAEGTARSRHNPINRLFECFKESEVVKNVSKVLGEEVGVYSIAFAPTKGLPTSSEWFDIRIQPLVRLPTREYEFTVIYRSKSRDRVQSFLKGVEPTLSSIFEVIEG
jgi:hypothetical protein